MHLPRPVRFALLASLLAAPAAAQAPTPTPSPAMQRLTPILIVEAIEPSIPFWIDRLGFARVAEVPEPGGDRLGFLMLARDDVQVMLQTWASMGQDLPALTQGPRGHSTLVYLDVADLEAVKPRLDGVEVVVPERTTFYGAKEIWVREPGGHVVGFAQHER